MPVDVSDLLRDGDPTRGIRRYIEQLQDAVRDACGRQSGAEEERDRLSQDVLRLRSDAEALRTEIRDARRDRDALSEQVSQYNTLASDLRQKAETAERQRLDVARQRDEAIKFYKDSQRQIEELMRVKDEAVKQRDAFGRQRDTAKKEKEEIAVKLMQTEAQLADARKVAADNSREEVHRQITALRQARDAAAMQCTELKNRVNQLEDEVAELTYARDHAVASATKASDESGTLRSNLEQAMTDAAARDEAVKDEVEELKKKSAALKRRNQTLGESVDALTTEVQEVRAMLDQTNAAREAEVAGLRGEMEQQAREREAEMEEYGTKLGELRAAHENELQLARQQYEAAMKERDAARTKAQERESELEEVRALLAETRSVVERLSSEGAEKARQVEAMKAERIRAEAAEQVLDEARSSLGDAQKQIEYVMRDRDAFRDQMEAHAKALEEKCRAQAAECAEARKLAETAQERVRGFEDLTKEHEEHRLQMIEVTAKLATAQAEIRELSAHLAEARLRMKTAAKSDAGEPLDHVIRNSLAALRKTFQEYLRQPADFSLLNELQNHAQQLADRARETNQMTVQRVSSVFAALTRELYEFPEQATPPTMRTVGQCIEFIGALLKEANLDQRVDLQNVRAFAVDDDLSVLDCVCESLQAAGIGASTTDSAGAALAELAESTYDLVILDVNLPELDGLELCTHMREMPAHTTTPVIFITGHASLENRVQFSLRGGSELLIKPFNLLELALRSVTLIIRTKLRKPAGT